MRLVDGSAIGGTLFLVVYVMGPGGPDEALPAPGNVGASSQSNGQAYGYVGTKRCRMCHVKQYRSWRELPKGRSWEALTPGAGADVKLKAGLDVQQDYTTDARCLRCHSVGYGKPGGYRIPERGDGRAARLAAARQGVGCEACHGPGSGFVKIMQDIFQTDRKHHPDDLRAAGRKTVGPEVCATCHNKDAICVSWKHEDSDTVQRRSPFQVSVTDRTGYHALLPLPRRAPDQKAEAGSLND